MNSQSIAPTAAGERRVLRFAGLRQHLRNLEGELPLEIQRPLWRLLRSGHSPYTQRDHDTRSIFIHVPKNAGTSIGRVLGVPRCHIPISRYAVFDRHAYKSYFKFAFVRNPWDRLLSAYACLLGCADRDFPFRDTIWARKHLAQFPDFEAFVLSLSDSRTSHRITNYIHFRPQIGWVTLPGSDRVELDFVGRYESLADDFRVIAERLSIDPTLPVTNRSERGSYKDAYTDRMRDIVANLYRADIEAFDYDF